MVSITYGSPRKHIRTYAIGFSDSYQRYSHSNCPCSQFPGDLPPSFVHDNYYCESGNVQDSVVSGVFTSDSIWDGEGCSSDNSCCSEPNLPWFYRQFPQTASENIETQICRDQVSTEENILIWRIQLYVQ